MENLGFCGSCCGEQGVCRGVQGFSMNWVCEWSLKAMGVLEGSEYFSFVEVVRR